MGDIQYNPFANLYHGILEMIQTQFHGVYNTLHYFELKVTYCLGAYLILKHFNVFDTIKIIF
jgi:hypothetical protein